jgi:hypothetical protein
VAEIEIEMGGEDREREQAEKKIWRNFFLSLVLSRSLSLTLSFSL